MLNQVELDKAPAVEDTRAGRTPVLDQAQWRHLVEAPDFAAFAVAFVALQCGLVSGARACSLTREDELVAVWPSRATIPGADAALAAARLEARGVVQPRPAEPDCFTLAYPVLVDGSVRAIVLVDLVAATDQHLRCAMRQLQWGIVWVRERFLLEAQAAFGLRSTALSAALDSLALVLEAPTFGAAARAFVTELAQRHDCERVSLGLVHRGSVHVAAISHSAKFSRQMTLLQHLGDAMDEALDQRAVIAFPAPAADVVVTRAHQALVTHYGAGAALTLPLFLRDRFIGALTFERHATLPFTDGTVAVLDAIAAAAGPALEEKRLNDRWLITKIAASLGQQLLALFGPGHVLRKLLLLAAIGLTVLFYVWTDTYRVTANAVIEGAVQRSVVAPFNGFLREAPVRAGQTVKAGDVLAVLDDRDLVLERLRWVTERQRHVLEYEQALGSRDRAQMQIVQTQIDQADAQIRLVDEQLSRTRLTAPFDGLVVSGDLTQSIGAAIQRGNVLFEVAPLDQYRVILDVDESQIGEIGVASAGQLVVSSLPTELFPLVVTRITPVASAHDGRNTFRVEATLTGAPAQLRPGMRGVAKVDVEERRVLWIWTRSFINWFRLAAWQWLY